MGDQPLMASAVFPFGRRSLPRPPRRPEGAAAAFLVGVYPSALHVRWALPAWAVKRLGPVVGALAVDDEPTVFWDGADADAQVAAWIDKVGFITGDDLGQWGHVTAAGNGSSGRALVDGVLGPLGLALEDVWCTDVVDRFFVKRAGEGAATREQGDVIDAVYAPFAEHAVLTRATLPSRPGTVELVAMGIADHRDRLRTELLEARAPLVVTVGEEARLVLRAIVDEADGPPTLALDGNRLEADPEAYGAPGALVVEDLVADWVALAHPAQRTPRWRALHDAWVARQGATRTA